MSKTEASGKKRAKTGGRQPGSQNKVTREFRQTVQKLLDENTDNVGRWLALVAEGDGSEHSKPDPGRALDLLSKLAEYASPKLARTEHSGNITVRTLAQELAGLNG